LNERAFTHGIEYFMRFAGKARYQGPFDAAGVPLLDYQGDIGRQYNPIAIAQYGLARFNAWCATGAAADRTAWITVADWLAREMRPNARGVRVWMHDFDWPYRVVLRAPWYSGLAQGNGLSMLVRAAKETGNASYADAAHMAFEPLMRSVDDGGVLVTDDQGDVWIEEYLVERPSHILNGFMWALWGVYDYAAWSRRSEAAQLWTRCANTLRRRVAEFDAGWWSLYEARDAGREMLASRYYHTLHITQLQVMYRLTGNEIFSQVATRFQSYLDRRSNRVHAFTRKAIFKLRHY
jgi:heparosan-N-sulfate-glucuronate 5-epimerase